MTVSIIIPARYDSSRFPGKPLAQIKLKSGRSKPLVQLSWEAATRIGGVNNIFIATDSSEIKKTAEGFGAKVILTSSKCENGTARCAEAVQIQNIKDDIIINFQGDAPLTPKSFVEKLVRTMDSDKAIQVSTPILRCTKSHFFQLLKDRQNGLVGATTAVFDNNRDALYFSKEVIPFLNNEHIRNLDLLPIYHHVGVYAFRKDALNQYTQWQESILEKLEGLEQLRFLDHNVKIRCVLMEKTKYLSWELNNPSDKIIIEDILGKLDVT